MLKFDIDLKEYLDANTIDELTIEEKNDEKIQYIIEKQKANNVAGTDLFVVVAGVIGFYLLSKII